MIIRLTGEVYFKINFKSVFLYRKFNAFVIFANLRKNNLEFIWSEKQQNPFDRLNVIMVKKPNVKIFDPKKDITVTTDVSGHLSSKEGRPIMYLSRRLRNTEFNFSNTKKEALAIVWTTTRLRKFLIGKKKNWEVIIESIFNPRKKLPKVTTPRILRWAIWLIAFNSDIEYLKWNSIPHVDALSRLWFYKESKDKTEEDFEDTFLLWVETDILTLDKMATETRHDPVLHGITSRIKKRMGKLFQGGKTRQRNQTEVNDRTWSDLLRGSDHCSRNTKNHNKNVHDHVQCGVAATQKKDKIRSMMARIFTRCRIMYLKNAKNAKN